LLRYPPRHDPHHAPALDEIKSLPLNPIFLDRLLQNRWMEKTMGRARKRSSKILLMPCDEQQLKARRKKLPIFESHDLRELIGESKNRGEADLDATIIRELHRRNDTQMKELLQCLGVDPSRSDAWLRGFFLLASLHHGVGHLAWYDRRTNTNSATWTSTHDLLLLREVMALQACGLSERSAIRQLVANSKKRSLFPYRRQGHFTTAER